MGTVSPVLRLWKSSSIFGAACWREARTDIEQFSCAGSRRLLAFAKVRATNVVGLIARAGRLYAVYRHMDGAARGLHGITGTQLPPRSAAFLQLVMD